MERASELSASRSKVFGLRKPYFVLSAILFCGLLLFQTKNIYAQTGQLYPDWFLQTPDTGHFYAIGYSPVQFYENSTINRAFTNLQEQLRAKRALKLHLTMFWQKLPDDSVILQGQEIVTDTLYSKSEPFSVASAVSGNMHLILGSLSESTPFPVTRMITAGSKPIWIDNTPSINDAWHSVGSARMVPSEEVCWIRAEKQGILELAQTKQTNLQMVQRKLQNATETVIKTESDVVLFDIQVVARWRDETNCYVLVKAGN